MRNLIYTNGTQATASYKQALEWGIEKQVKLVEVDEKTDAVKEQQRKHREKLAERRK